jgi:Flp pilus assembly protein TadG
MAIADGKALKKGARGARLRSFLSDTTAATLPIMAASLVPTMAMVGGGIDFGRAYLAQSKLQGAVDAGALAAVRAKQLSSNSNSASETIGKDFIKANFPSGYLGAALAEEKVKVTEKDDLVKAEVTVSGTVSTTLLRLVGIDTLPFAAQATAEASDTLPNSVEALLVLDNTGSMASGGKMKSLKTASKNFVDTIYGDKNTRDGFAVGILPYNTMVNVGRLVRMHDTDMVQSYPGYTDKNPSTDDLAWKGCVFADQTIQNISSDRFKIDAGAFDVGDQMPGEKINGLGDAMPKIEPFVYPPIFVDSFQDINNRYKIPSANQGILDIPTVRDALIRLHGNDICVHTSNGDDRECDQPNSRISIDRLPDEDDFKTSKPYGHYSGTKSGASPWNLWGASPNYQCPAQALPISYSNTKSGLRTYIDDENEALLPGTGTFHNAAMTWAYRMMSRDDVFPRARPTSVPVKKVVIFMTDGNFDSRDDGRKDSSGKKILDTAYTAYKTYEDRLIITNTSRDDTIDNLEYRFGKTCEAMKAEGIEIYTIAFALSNNSRGDRTRDMFRACATDRNTHFFSAADGNDLNEAFVTIASELVNLRLTR